MTKKESIKEAVKSLNSDWPTKVWSDHDEAISYYEDCINNPGEDKKRKFIAGVVGVLAEAIAAKSVNE